MSVGIPGLLTGSRICLTPLGRDDLAAIAGGTRQSNWAGDFPTDGDRFVARLGLELDDEQLPWCHYQVSLKSGLVIGGVGFHGIPINNTVEIGYGIVGSQRGFGYAGEAVSLLIELARNSPMVSTVRARTAPKNHRSQHVLERVGFSHVSSSAEELVYLIDVEH